VNGNLKNWLDLEKNSIRKRECHQPGLVSNIRLEVIAVFKKNDISKNEMQKPKHFFVSCYL
jgi:hypothetical protein